MTTLSPLHQQHTHYTLVVTAGFIHQAIPAHYLAMTKSRMCRSNGGSDKKKGPSSRRLWKEGLCRKCHAAGNEVLVKATSTRKKKKYPQTRGRRMVPEYVRLSCAQVKNKDVATHILIEE